MQVLFEAVRVTNPKGQTLYGPEQYSGEMVPFIVPCGHYVLVNRNPSHRNVSPRLPERTWIAVSPQRLRDDFEAIPGVSMGSNGHYFSRQTRWPV